MRPRPQKDGASNLGVGKQHDAIFRGCPITNHHASFDERSITDIAVPVHHGIRQDMRKCPNAPAVTYILTCTQTVFMCECVALHEKDDFGSLVSCQDPAQLNAGFLM